MSVSVATPAISPLRPPGPRGHLLFGSTLDLRRAPLQTLIDSWRTYGDVVHFRFGGPFFGYLVAHPEGAKRILQDRPTSYGKVPWYNEKLRSVIGSGLFTSEGEAWRQQRRLAQPAFHRQRLATLTTVMTDAANELVERWLPIAAAGEAIDVRTEMMRLTMTVVARALLGAEVSGDVDSIGGAIEFAIAFTFDRMQSYLDLPGKLPLPSTKRFMRSRALLDAVVYRIIRERRESGEDRGDLLSMLLAAQDEETGQSMDDEQVHDEAMTIFLAGHETTAVALTWAWYILAQHPEIAERLAAELETTLHGRAPTIDDLPQLPYTQQVVAETLRLYPPAWLMSRMALEDDEIMGYRVAARRTIFLCPFIIHRHPDFWDDPEEVDPERFSPERIVGRHRYAYFPFGGGPRQCIGNNFALMEAQLTLATVAQRFRLELVPGQRVLLDPKITLRPRDGLVMRLRAL